ncbi:hypothetical protein [Brevibacillus migulae]|uniref:hypothetical protein n=1 Tax=Brevibacillus migulae TaxID=1644114 RepID=UPI00106E33E8|nr:hypothetical protein [Brevibacillus migulae]
MMGGTKKNGNGKNGQKKKANVAEDSAEFIIMALLLADQLKFQSILVDREGTVAITLEGQIKKKDQTSAQKMADFLEENGGMTLDEAIEGLRLRLEGR